MNDRNVHLHLPQVSAIFDSRGIPSKSLKFSMDNEKLFFPVYTRQRARAAEGTIQTIYIRTYTALTSTKVKGSEAGEDTFVMT